MKIMRVSVFACLLIAAVAHADDAPRSYSYRTDVQPVLETHCVVCHACYDAPCQLKMETPDGLSRGASKAPVYGPGVSERPTSRLFVDAQSTEEWRRKGFFSVVEGGASSLLGRMLELGRLQADKAGQPVPGDVVMGVARQNTCPSLNEFDAYAHRHMHEGMPFGMAPLPPDAYRTLSGWLAQGAPIDGMNEPDRSSAQPMIDAWEEFMNRQSPRDRLLARYLYEHVFIAHLYLDRAASSGFFEMVRSTTAPGSPIDVVPTRRPTDDPGDHIYYRLRPVRGSIVEKTHITYYFGAEKLARVQSLFEGDWKVDQLPPYMRDGCTNPFKIFEAIPARMRYQFMLDDAHFFVQSFIRGPVCLGQVATDVIEDHFYTMFQSPASDVFCQDADYATTQMQDVSLDGREGFSIDVLPKWMRAEMRYAKKRSDRYASAQGPGWGDLWDGDGGRNLDACMTIFRNFDSATVIRGFRGRVPESMWVMDYPIFERIYYLLVVNFDVFGSAAHQIGTRLYFDLLRAESEVNFLRWLPAASRAPLQQSWYRGVTARLKTKAIYPDPDLRSGSQLALPGGDAKGGFVDLVRHQLPAIAGQAGELAGAIDSRRDAALASGASQTAEATLSALAEGTGGTAPFLLNLPETAFVRVEVDGGANDLAFTLNRVKAHTSVAMMFREGSRLEPKSDYLVLLRGPVGCYPNFIFHVKLDQLSDFVSTLKDATTPAAFQAVVSTYGVRRTHPSFWADFAFFRQYHARREPVEAGIYDANRYENY